MKKSLFIILFVIAFIFVMISSVYTYRFTMKDLVALNGNTLKSLLYYKAEEINAYLTEEHYLFKKFYEKNLKCCNELKQIKEVFGSFWGNHNHVVRSVLLTTYGSVILSVKENNTRSSAQLLESNLKTFFSSKNKFDVYSLEKFLNYSSPNLFFVSPIFQVKHENGSTSNVVIIEEYNFNKILHGLSVNTKKLYNTIVDFWVVNRAEKVVGSSTDMDSLYDVRVLFKSIQKNQNYDLISAPFVMHGDNYKLMMTINNRSYTERIVSPAMIIVFFAINIGIILIMLVSIPFFIQRHKKYEKLKDEVTLLKIKLDLNETESLAKNIESSNFFKTVKNNKSYLNKNEKPAD